MLSTEPGPGQNKEVNSSFFILQGELVLMGHSSTGTKCSSGKRNQVFGLTEKNLVSSFLSQPLKLPGPTARTILRPIGSQTGYFNSLLGLSREHTRPVRQQAIVTAGAGAASLVK